MILMTASMLVFLFRITSMFWDTRSVMQDKISNETLHKHVKVLFYMAVNKVLQGTVSQED